MKLDAMLCNHAEAVNNLLYTAGAGINVCNVPPGAPAPYGVSLGIGMLVTVGWQQTNQRHKVEITLIGEDGQDVAIPTGPDTSAPFHFEFTFNVGRPPGLPPGDDQIIALATNFAGFPMPATGKYEFVISIDGDPDPRRLALRVQQTPGAQMTF